MKGQLMRVVRKALSVARKVKANADPVVWAYEAQNALRSRRKFDGAIVTLTVFNNYGNVIQRYALQHFLKKNGYMFTMLDLHSGIINKNHQQIRRFVKRYLTQEKFNPKVSGRHGAYIVGSDQVWRHFSINKTWEKFGIQFLSFVSNKHAKRIAYAASFGVDTLEEAGINDWHRKMIRPQLKKFDAISVREKSGQDLVKQLGSSGSAQVLDPTMLLPASDYSDLIEKSVYRDAKSSEVFYYLIEQTALTESAIKFYKDKTGGESFGILPYAKDVPLTPIENWLKSIRDAEVVVTDSYHALVFSIIFHTEFIVFDKSLGGIARITELLEPLGLTDRIIIQGETKKFDVAPKPINWAKVDEVLNKKRKESAEWLLAALSDSKDTR